MDPPAPSEHISSEPGGGVPVQSPPDMSSVDSSDTPSVIDTMDPKTAEKIQAYQSQIKILLYNYQILEKNELNLSEEDVKSNMQKVEKLLLKFSRKQTRLTEKWLSSRPKPEETKEEPVSNETSPGGSPPKEATTPTTPTPTPEGGPEEEDKTSSGGNSNDGSMMAPPPVPLADTRVGFRGGGSGKRGRGGRRGGRGGGGNGVAAALAAQRQKQREDEAAAIAAALGLDVSAELVLKPGQYKGDITEDEMMDTRVTKPDKSHDTEYLEPDDAVVPRDGLTFGAAALDLTQFALNIGLLTPEGSDLVARQMSDERRVKNNWRNLTYVPEISDRKQRVRYTYLSTEMSSPPLLRARGHAGAAGSLHQAQLRGVKSRSSLRSTAGRAAAADSLQRQDSNY